MTKTAIFLSVILLLSTTVVAFADGPYSVTFASGPGSDWKTWAGYYVSPYTGTVTIPGHTPANSVIPLYCIDFNHDIGWGERFDGTFTQIPLPQATDQLNFALNEAAWIFENVSNQVTAQVAVWDLLVPLLSPTRSPSFATTLAGNLATAGAYTQAERDASAAVGAAQVLGGTGLRSAWDLVYVAPLVLDGTHPQYFLTPGGANNENPPVPEPASILLLGVVLVGSGRSLARRWS